MTWDDIIGYYDWGVYYKSVVDDYPGGLLVEVGNYLGRSVCHLAQLVKASGKPFHIVAVDTGLGSGVENGHDHHGPAVEAGGGTLAGQLHRNVLACGVGDVVTLITGPSVRAAQLFADHSCTMVFLDAAHDYDSVCADIMAWGPKVKPGHPLAGDDYGTPNEADDAVVWPGVRRAVKELCPGHEPRPHDAWEWRKR